MLELTAYIKIFVALLVIVDPVGVVPLFAVMTAGDSPQVRARVARTASIAVAVVLVVSVLAGESILALFGITIASFKVGGAILILLMAISMLHAQPLREKQTPDELEEATSKVSVAVVPLAIPLLAGPGTISTAIIYAAAGHGLLHRLLLVAVCVAVALSIWLALSLGTHVTRLLGQTGINITIRLMGLILAAVSVEIFVSGIVTLLPGLGAPHG